MIRSHLAEPERQGCQRICVELVITQVKRGIYGLEGLEIDVHFLLLVVICEYRAAIDYETIWRHLSKEFQALLRGSDSGENGKAIDSRFDVRRSPKLIGEHLSRRGNLSFGRHNLCMLAYLPVP